MTRRRAPATGGDHRPIALGQPGWRTSRAWRRTRGSKATGAASAGSPSRRITHPRYRRVQPRAGWSVGTGGCAAGPNGSGVRIRRVPVLMQRLGAWPLLSPAVLYQPAGSPREQEVPRSACRARRPPSEDDRATERWRAPTRRRRRGRCLSGPRPIGPGPFSWGARHARPAWRAPRRRCAHSIDGTAP